MKHIVLFEDVTDADKAILGSATVQVHLSLFACSYTQLSRGHLIFEMQTQLHSFSDLTRASEGTAEGLEIIIPAPNDLAILMFTSGIFATFFIGSSPLAGTTGDPKGVLLTHQNVLASSTGLLRASSDVEG